MERLRQLFSSSHDSCWNYDSPALSGTVLVNSNAYAGEMHRAPTRGKSLYRRWEQVGMRRVFANDRRLAMRDAEPKTVMTDAACFRAHHMALSLWLRRGISAA